MSSLNSGSHSTREYSLVRSCQRIPQALQIGCPVILHRIVFSWPSLPASLSSRGLFHLCLHVFSSEDCPALFQRSSCSETKYVGMPPPYFFSQRLTAGGPRVRSRRRHTGSCSLQDSLTTRSLHKCCRLQSQFACRYSDRTAARRSHAGSSNGHRHNPHEKSFTARSHNVSSVLKLYDSKTLRQRHNGMAPLIYQFQDLQSHQILCCHLISSQSHRTVTSRSYDLSSREIPVRPSPISRSRHRVPSP